MDLPKFNETFSPILTLLKDGKTIKSRELVRLVEKQFYSHLPKELLKKKTKSGPRLIDNRINWGKSYLKQSGFIHYPQRGYVQITEKGQLADVTTLSLEDVRANILNIDELETTKTLDATLSPQDLIDTGIKEIEREVESELLLKLQETDPYYFERVVLLLLEKMGYGEFTETPKSGDGGIDGIINQDQLGLEKIYVQAKRYSENKVRETDIRNFIGAMSGDTRKGIFVTTSTFDDKAIKKAQDSHHTIILIDGFKLVTYMYKYNVGVQVAKVYEVKILDNDFFEFGER